MFKNIKLIENILYYSGLILGIYVVIYSLYLRFTLPSGVCPLTNTRPLTILALALLLSSLVISFFSKTKNK